MREPVRDPGRLEHILTAINRIFQFVKDKSKSEIQKDSVLYFALVKNIEIIGEAAYMLSPEFRESHKETPWRVIIGMRHFLVHGYYEVDPEEVWNVVEKDLMPLKDQIESYLKEY
ncbi:MAG: DUF86 domain-containing protein [Bacteroidales bacterium]|nr:DUF86 domain-containing protein [Bacteroidales bacterium]